MLDTIQTKYVRLEDCMNLRGISFSAVTMMAGACGFEGEGYRHHFISRLFGMIWWGVTFVAKTVTAEPRKGFMETVNNDNFTPAKLLPDCIVCGVRQIWHAVVLNVVGLTNVGIKAQLARGAWQKRRRNFFVSFMAVGASLSDKLTEARTFAEELGAHLHEFSAKIGIEVNFSCPNVGAKKRPPEEFIAECHQILDILGELELPLLAKFSVTTEPEVVMKIAENRAVDGITITNTVTFGELPERINWKLLFGTDVSPLLAKFGFPGGLSGAPLLPLVCEWIAKLRALGFTKHINGGGGVLWPWDVWKIKRAGADSIALGTIGTLRPFAMPLTLATAHLLFGRR